MISFSQEVLLCIFVAQFSLILGFFASLLTEITVDTKSIRGQKTIFSVAVLANTRLTTINLEDKAEVKVD